MWGYSYTTTDNKLVIVNFLGKNTGDVQTLIFDKKDLKWNSNSTPTYGSKLQGKRS